MKTLKNFRKLPLFVSFLFFAILFGLSLFGKRGVLHLLYLQKQLNALKKENLYLQIESTKFEKDIKLLKENFQYIEDVAREDLGMIKAGEKVYVFPSPTLFKKGSSIK